MPTVLQSHVLPGQLSRGLRLHYLDGLRAVAALYVVAVHAYQEIISVPGWMPETLVRATHAFSNGLVAVQVFIVLSGYCLMLPVARSGQLKGGWTGFVRRRARRILPPYYAALGLSLLLILCVPGLGVKQGGHWDNSLPALTPGVIGSHLLLFQDLRPDWIFKINYPMWTIAQEWQIYFLFAFLFLPIWRRVGVLPVVLLALLASDFLRRAWDYKFQYVAPGFLFLFTVGMLAAAINFSPQPERVKRLVNAVPWTGLAIGLWLAYAVVTVRFANQPDRFSSTLFCLLAGAASLALIVACTASTQGAGTNPLLRAFEWSPLVFLGGFSYSLYLIHAPVLALFALALRGGSLSAAASLVILLAVAVPVSVALAYGFHIVAERPFMSLPKPATTPAS